MFAGRFALWSALACALCSPSVAYRTRLQMKNNILTARAAHRGKQLVDKTNIPTSEEEEEADATSAASALAVEADVDATQNAPSVLVKTESDAEAVLKSNDSEVVMRDSLLDLSEGTPASKRTVGNMLATMGLLHSEMVLGMAAQVLPVAWVQQPSSLHGQGSGGALVEQFSRGGDIVPDADASGMTSIFRVFGLLAVAGILFLGFRFVFNAAIGSKVGNEGVTTPEVLDCLAQMAKVYFPVCAALLATTVGDQSAVVIVGNVGTKEMLASCGLGQIVFAVMSSAFVPGLCNPMDTFVSAAWGSGDKNAVVGYLSKARLLGLIQVVWVWPVLYNIEHIFVALGQEPGVARYLTPWCRWVMVGYPIMVLNQSNRIMLKNIGDPVGALPGFLVGNCVYVASAFFFLAHLQLGTMGLGIAWCLNLVASKIVNDTYLLFMSDLRDQSRVELMFLHPKHCYEVTSYFKLAMFDAGAITLETFAQQANTLIVGLLGSTVLAGHVAANAVNIYTQMGCQAWAQTCSTFTGTLLGARKAALLRAMLILFQMVILCIWFAIFCIVMTFRDHLAEVFVRDPDTHGLAVNLMSINACILIIMCVGWVASFSLRGFGQQRVVFFIAVGCNYLITIPLSYFAAHVGLGVYVVYLSGAFGNFVLACCYLYALSRLDLEQEVEKASVRLEMGRTHRTIDASSSTREPLQQKK